MAYASKYYDPQKAHEYYMRTRELKGYEGRYDGTERAAKKEATNTSYQQRISANNAKVSSITSATKARSTTVNSQIKALQAQYKAMSKSERKANRSKIQAQIKALRAQLKTERNASKAQKQSIREETKRLRTELKAKNQEYADEAQREKQNSDSTSTAGFNQKGKEAAEYIKSQIEAEREKVNETIGSEYNDAMDQLFERIKNGYYENEKGAQKDARRLLNGIRARRKQLKAEYAQKYKDEIKKLRKDDSMWTYWDKRKAAS